MTVKIEGHFGVQASLEVMTSISLLKNSFGKVKKTKKKDDEAKIEEFIYHRLKKEKARWRDVFEELSAHVIDVFRALGDLDVRFDFDPFSFDDCRCDLESAHVVNVLCSLKHVPLESLVIVEDDIPGRVKVRLHDGFVDRYDGPCWQDICSHSSSGQLYLDSTKLLQCFSTLLVQAVHDVNCERGTAFVSLFRDQNMDSLRIQLSDGNVYQIKLFPSIRVNEFCKNFECLKEGVTRNSKSVLDKFLVKGGIHLVARPDDLNQGEFWRITFNDIERRILLSNAFQCADDCVFLLRMFNDLRMSGAKAVDLPYYHLKMIVLREIFEHPKRNEWNRKLLQKVMLRLLESLEDCLRKGRCLHVFTGVNLFSNMNPDSLKENSVKISRLRERNPVKDLLAKE